MLKSRTITEERAPKCARADFPAIHPGVFLAEILAEFGLSQADLAHTIDVSPMRISHVVNGDRPVTADLALRLNKALGQSAEYWLNLQLAYDLAMARKAAAQSLKRIETLTSA